MVATLLLNSGFEPLRVISWQRAITLLVLGKVDVVEAYDTLVRSVNHALAMPSVVRLRRYTRGSGSRVKFSRANVYRRDGLTCQYCGARPGPDALTLDHVLPRARGGRTEWTNVVAACVACNARKADRTPEQAGMKLARAPSRPTFMPAVGPSEAAHPTWLGYLA